MRASTINYVQRKHHSPTLVTTTFTSHTTSGTMLRRQGDARTTRATEPSRARAKQQQQRQRQQQRLKQQKRQTQRHTQ